MPLSSVQCQERALGALRSALQSGAVHHAYLFGGPEGVGKELAALGFVQALFCAEAPHEGCGKCSSCLRIERRNHPDVSWVMPEEEQVARGFAGRADFDRNPSRDIKVNQIRKLQERLMLRPFEGRWKAAIITLAERLNDQAQNAFLKTLEEPPRDTVLILVTSGIERLLPTVRSRLSPVLFGPLPEAFLVEKVKEKRKLDPKLAHLLAVLSGGSLEKALSLDVDVLEQRAQLLDLFESAASGDADALLRFAETYGDSRPSVEGALDVLELWLRDLAALQSGGETLAMADLGEFASRTAAKVSAFDLHRRHRLLNEARLAMDENNASPRLQLEKLLVGAL
jgi:DNA polymerase III subunit delta'